MSKCADKIYKNIKESNDSDVKRLAKGVTKKNIEKMLLDLKNNADTIFQTGGASSPKEALDKAYEKKLEEVKLAAENNKKNIREHIIAKAKQREAAEAANGDINKVEGIWVSGKGFKGTGVRTGTQDSITAWQSKLLHSKGAITPELEKNDLLKYLGRSLKDNLSGLVGLSRSDTLAFQYEVANQNLRNEFDDTLAGKAAKIFNQQNKYVREILNNNGININDLETRVTAQYNNPTKMLRPSGFHKEMMKRMNIPNSTLGRAKYINEKLKMGSVELDKMQRDVAFEMWYKYRRPQLDDAKTFSDLDTSNEDNIKKKMREDFDEMTKPPKAEDKLKPEPVTNPSIWNQMENRHRKYIAKDGKSFVDYSIKYGAGDLLENVERETHTLAHALALTESWGPKPIQAYKELRDEMFGDRTDSNSLNRIKRMNTMMSYLGGEIRPDSDHMLGRYVRSILTWNVLKSLGSVTFKSLPDMVLNWRQLDSWGTGFKSKTIGIAKGFTKGKSDSDLEELYSSLGVMSKHMIGNRHVVDPRSFRGIGSKYEAAMMQMNMLPRWDQTRKRTAFAGLSHYLAKYSDTKFDNLPDKLKRKFDLYALKPEQWDAWRKGAYKIDGVKYLSPHHVLDASDEDITSAMGNGKNKDQLRDALYRKLSGMFHGEYKYVVPGNDLYARSQRAFNLQTNWGQALNLIMQFKSYAIGYVKDVLGRDIYESKSKKHAMLNLASTITSTMAISLVGTMATNALLKNRKTHLDIFSNNKYIRENADENWIEAAKSALGIFSDGVSAFSNPTLSSVSSLLGPTATNTVNAGLFYHEQEKHFSDWWHNKRSRQKKSSALLTEQAVANNMPFHNTPIVSAIMNHLVSKYIMDFIQPHSYEQQRNNLKNKHGITPLFGD